MNKEFDLDFLGVNSTGQSLCKQETRHGKFAIQFVFARLREIQDGHKAIFLAADSCFVGNNRYLT